MKKSKGGGVNSELKGTSQKCKQAGASMKSAPSANSGKVKTEEGNPPSKKKDCNKYRK